MKQGFIWETPMLNVYEQMAADEVLCVDNQQDYSIRFFNWSGIAASYGYSQRSNDIKRVISESGKNIIHITRRPTGGGLVFHESDITFSFIFPLEQLHFEPNSIYKKLHLAISKEYLLCGKHLGIMSEKTKSYAVNSPTMSCFSNPVSLDLLSEGKKVLGGALRKLGQRMLYQASLQLPSARKSEAFHRRVIIKAMAKEFGIIWQVKSFAPKMLEKLKEISEKKYKSSKWNERI